MIIKNCVLLLKSQKNDSAPDRYEEILASGGFQVRQVKTLLFDFKNLAHLESKLRTSENFIGILFSSPRCVQAVHLATQDNRDILVSWRSKYNFVVGEATYRDALEKCNIICKGQETGNSENLAKYILANKTDYDKPFLFPHGNLKTDTLKDELGKEGIIVEGVLVYDTISNPGIETELANFTNHFYDIPEYIIFFSPSGLRSSINYLKRIPDFSEAKLIAIGPITEKAMKEANLNVYGVTKNPTPKDLLDLILS